MKTFSILLIVSIGVALVSSKVTVEEGKRLIKTSEEDPGKWLTEDEILALIRNKQTFIDVTDFNYPPKHPSKVVTAAIPDAVRFQAIVERVKERRSIGRVEAFIRHFSSYHTRYYASQTGRESQLWLLSQVQESVRNYTGRWTVNEVDHGYLQKSIVARLEGADPTLKDEVVIFGAHLDSVNSRGSALQSPGADDNGSGSSVVLETLRAIAEDQLILNRTVEFHWYAAEEIGLRGSQALAEDYSRRNVNVHAMLNMDVVGYHVNGIDDIGVFTDNTEAPDLVQFLRVLTDAYVDGYGWRNRTCGYGCSDHASWTRNGFNAVMASEIVPHPQMHTVNDNVDNMSFDQVIQFIKLATGFIIELAEPNKP